MWRRGLLVGLALTLAASAWAQEKTEAPDRYSPAAQKNGPSLSETGRIGEMPVTPVLGSPTAIPEPDVGDKGERSVQKAAAAVEAPRPARVGTINPATLEREIAERLATLDDCRIEVGRQQQLPPGEIQADTLTLRWTIRRTGDVTATEVVATAPVDLKVMDCVKAAMSTWTFTRPRGGPLPVERAFHFRPLPTSLW